MNTGDVSFVIPAYNVKSWVARAIRSALTQGPGEVIVVDDGSTDGTGGVLEEFGDQIRVIRQHNQGIAAARNAGAQTATTNAIFFLDADDALVDGALTSFAQAASEAPAGWAAVTSNWIRETPTADRVALAGLVDRRTLRRADLPMMLRHNWLQTNSLVDTATWRAFPYRDHVTKDHDLWIRLMLADRPVVLLAEPLVRVATGRPGALTTQRAVMRANRRRTYTDVWSRTDLTTLERLITAYQLLRTSAGEASARHVEYGEDARAATQALTTSESALVRGAGHSLRLPGLISAIAALDRGENPS